MSHQELSIEALFDEYLAEKYKCKINIKIADVVKHEMPDEALAGNLSHINKEEIAVDVFKALQYAYNKKYGNWDEVNDLRTLYPDRWYASLAPYTCNLPDHARILSVGANDGREILQLFQNKNIALDVLDISSKAISRAQEKLKDYANTRFLVNTFEKCELEASVYDLLVSLRTLNSTAVNIPVCLRKSVQSVKASGMLIYSVANGYVQEVDGKLIPVKGMFSHRDNAIDVDKPKQIARQIVELLEANGMEIVDSIDDISEIFVIARKKRGHSVSS